MSAIRSFLLEKITSVDILIYERNTHKRRTAQLLTVEFSIAGIQRLEIDGVVCDEAFLLVHRQLVPLDLDPSGLMDQY